MKYLNKIASVFCAAAMGLTALTSCEGADLYGLNAPDWLSGTVDSIAASKVSNVISVTPNPTTLGAADNSTPWWTEFTDDIKMEPGESYEVKFTNYGGTNNWKNFLIVFRNEAKDYEYGVFRSDNWCWNTEYGDGAQSDNFCIKQMESSDRDWATWLKAMSRAQCTATLSNNGDGTADIKVIMLGSDGATYTQEYKNISVDKDNLYFCFTCEGSHLEFGDFTDLVDSEPTAITLNGVPRKVMQGTTFENAFANITATVTFGEGLTKDVTAEELQIMAIPDLSSLGTKSLVAIYNKTYLGENCTTPVIAKVDFEVVDKMYTSIGATDNSTAFWGAHSDKVKVGPKETFVSSFTNYTSGQNNWNNFVVVLTNADGSTEYSVLRADNFGWGTGYGACTHEGNQDEWATWLAAMDGAKVTVYTTNNGDGTADVKMVMVGNNGKTYTQTYTGINTVNADDFYFHLTVDGCHMELDNVVGAEDNSTAFWGAHSDMIKIPSGTTYTQRFKNFTNGQNNWNNFVVVLTKADNYEYAVVRADNFGWGDCYAACTHEGTQGDWATWLAAMDEATVTVSVTNNGTSADIKCVMVGNNGVTYTQNYIGISPIDANDLYFRFTVDGSHLVFE